MEAKKKTIGVMLDCSRNAIIKIESLKELVVKLSQMGYNVLQLYTEDTLLIEGEPYFGYLRGAYSASEIKELVDFAEKYNIEIQPCIQTLAHLNCLLQLPKYEKYKDIDDILLCDDENTYVLLDKMFNNAAKIFKSRRINIGMDEASHVGLGKHLLRCGYEERKTIILRHLKKIIDIASKYGFECMMWSDMLFDVSEDGAQYVVNNQAVEGVSEKVKLVYWWYYSKEKEYYEKMIDKHLSIGKNIGFAGGAWTWTGFAPNNHYAFDTFIPALQACNQKQIDEVYLTVWGDNGAECPYAAALPALCVFGLMANGISDSEQIKRKFENIVGKKIETFMLCDKINDIGINKAPIQNPSKYMLYNDPFLGVVDSSVEENDAAEFRDIAKKYKSLLKDAEYGWLFELYYRLAKALEVKCDLGVRTRRAYMEKDLETLNRIVCDYKKAYQRIKQFKQSFEVAWHKEKKGFGYEVHEIRLSGVLGRLEFCQRKLEKYINGEIDNIEELEVPVLDYEGNGAIKDGKKIIFNYYRYNCTTGTL